MKCKHMHKDAPEQDLCGDCFIEADKIGKMIKKFEKMKGGKENGNKRKK